MESTQSFVMEFEKALLQINRIKSADQWMYADKKR